VTLTPRFSGLCTRFGGREVHFSERTLSRRFGLVLITPITLSIFDSVLTVKSEYLLTDFTKSFARIAFERFVRVRFPR
jgi:hypothetical protein